MAKFEITDRTKGAISAVASDCLFDMDARGARSKRVMAEVALDADRLKTFGFTEAHDEIRALIDAHGYPAVEREVRKFVPTA